MSTATTTSLTYVVCIPFKYMNMNGPNGTYECPFCGHFGTCFTCVSCFAHPCDEYGCGNFLVKSQKYCPEHKH